MGCSVMLRAGCRAGASAGGDLQRDTERVIVPEWIVQKLTEIGATSIGFIECDRSVVHWDDDRARRQGERLRRVAREAAMQSRRVWLPEVLDVVPFADGGRAAELRVGRSRRSGCDRGRHRHGADRSGGWLHRCGAGPRDPPRAAVDERSACRNGRSGRRDTC